MPILHLILLFLLTSCGSGLCLRGDDCPWYYAEDDIYVLDEGAQSLYKVSFDGYREVVHGPGVGTGVSLSGAKGLANGKYYGTYFYSVIPASNEIVVTDTYMRESKVVSSSTVGSGESIVNPVTIGYTFSYVYVLCDSSSGLLRDVHNRTAISNGSRGSGPLFSSPRAIKINNTESKAYVATATELFEVDISTGNRIIVSDSSTGTGVNFLSIVAVLLGEDEERVFVLDNSLNAIIEVNLATGNRTVVSSSAVGSGAVFSSPTAFVFSLDFKNFYVIDTGTDSLIRVSLSDGSRETISYSGDGKGPNFNNPTGIVIGRDYIFPYQ